MKPVVEPKRSAKRASSLAVQELLPLRSIPLNKSILAECAQTYAASIRKQADKFTLLVGIKATEEYLKALKAEILPAALAHAESQRANGIHATEAGVKFTVRTESTWDFSRDVKHRQLVAQVESAKASLKAREEFLKKLALPVVEDGVEVVPPVIAETSSSLAITLPA